MKRARKEAIRGKMTNGHTQQTPDLRDCAGIECLHLLTHSRTLRFSTSTRDLLAFRNSDYRQSRRASAGLRRAIRPGNNF